MRLLIDEHQLTWDQAWDLTVRTFGYTNHTLLPEALETWPLGIFGEALPRHLELIYEINERFLEEVRAKFPGDEDRVGRMSLIGEDGGKCVRMAHLATVGSHAVNGVAALHSELLKASVLKDFYEMWPERFGNVTNGVTPRRFLALSNPGLRELLDDTIGPGWLTDLGRLKGLESFVDDPAFRQRWREVKRANKSRLAEYVHSATGIELDPTWMFDVQVKRIHEYKRQHLMVLHIITLYHRLKQNPGLAIPPRVFIFGGKAAPGYFMAKRIIKLITAVGATVNNDPDVNRYLKVVFLPNFNVKNAHLVYPAANLSEQISTAGKEASGTGNMKFMINGALTIGTLDGANVEIRQEAGAENFFLFGLTESQVDAVKAEGYRPLSYVERDPELAVGAGAARERACSPTATPRCCGRSSTTSCTTTRSWRWPTTGPTSTARIRSRGPGWTARRGRGCRSATPRAAACSPATGRSRSTATRSGAWARCPSTSSSLSAALRQWHSSRSPLEELLPECRFGEGRGHLIGLGLRINRE